MLKATIKTLILAGGVGNRLFPISTPQLPKQFHDLVGVGKTLIQQTFDRALEISDDVYVSANIAHKKIIQNQLDDFDNIFFEELALNTAYPIKLACEKLKTGVMVVMPADHIIGDGFAKQVAVAAKLAEQGKVVTFGIKPTNANPNFGYILHDKFIEKPNAEIAVDLIMQGALWNSGIFVFDIEVMLAEFAAYCPHITAPISFDKAIMEKTSKLAVIEAEFEWADIGSFEALENLKNKAKVA